MTANEAQFAEYPLEEVPVYCCTVVDQDMHRLGYPVTTMYFGEGIPYGRVPTNHERAMFSVLDDLYTHDVIKGYGYVEVDGEVSCIVFPSCSGDAMVWSPSQHSVGGAGCGFVTYFDVDDEPWARLCLDWAADKEMPDGL